MHHSVLNLEACTILFYGCNKIRTIITWAVVTSSIVKYLQVGLEPTGVEPFNCLD
jgi:hypothetical protein